MRKSNDILEELKSLNSSLVDKPAGNPFKVPEGYFSVQSESVRELLFGQVKIESESDVFQVPKDYFSKQRETLKAELLEEKTNRGSLRTLWRRVGSIAAILCLFALGAYLWPSSLGDDSVLASLDEQAIMNYLDEEGLDEMLFASVIDTETDLWSEIELDDSSVSSYILDSDDLLINEYLDYE